MSEELTLHLLDISVKTLSAVVTSRCFVDRILHPKAVPPGPAPRNAVHSLGGYLKKYPFKS